MISVLNDPIINRNAKDKRRVYFLRSKVQCRSSWYPICPLVPKSLLPSSVRRELDSPNDNFVNSSFMPMAHQTPPSSFEGTAKNCVLAAKKSTRAKSWPET